MYRWILLAADGSENSLRAAAEVVKNVHCPVLVVK